MGDYGKEPMLELFVFETLQLLENLEQAILNGEKADALTGMIPEIFRTMHTIKGSAAMMRYESISEVAHAIEDLFFFLREKKPQQVDTGRIIDLVLEGIDFIKNEIGKIEAGQAVNGSADSLLVHLKDYLRELEAAQSASEPDGANNPELSVPADYLPRYHAIVKFAPDCGFEDVQAFALLSNLKKKAVVLETQPHNFIDDDTAIQVIKERGLVLTFHSKLDPETLQKFLINSAFVNEVKLDNVMAVQEDLGNVKREIILDESEVQETLRRPTEEPKASRSVLDKGGTAAPKHHLISVSIHKLDVLLDLVGELVISEAMVIRNPELEGLVLDNFVKSSRQLQKITNELQDVVMSLRMVPLAATFQKMQRIVRDMSRKLGKDVRLELIGEETEVDKNIIEHISDPLMHLIRNAMDHGIESKEERREKNKVETGRIILEAKHAGSDVLIEIKDDGRGLNREKIIAKAKANGLLTKPEQELSDKEVYSFTLLPGFSTKEKVTEFSGRGVGMDVVVKSIEKVGGVVQIDSEPGAGTVITLKIPLTLAIVDGMTVRVGASQYTVPITAIRESFRMKAEDLITDPDGNEMVLVRGQCYPVFRLHRLFGIKTEVTQVEMGIAVMVENNDKTICLFADELLGEQQVVVKALPKYIKKARGISGCTLLGDGSISLILNVPGLMQGIA